MLRRRTIAVLLAATTLFASGSPRADVAPDASASATTAGDAHRRAIVAHVGPRAISAGDLKDHLARIPRFQLRLFGTTSSEVVRNFFDRVFIRDVLLSLGAEEKHLDHDVSVEQAIDRTLSGATLREIINQVGPIGNVSMDEVQRYYDANRSRYDSKDRINIWRILCRTSDEAQTVLDKAKQDGSLPTFMQLSRDHNLDKATMLRGGNLGFVGEGGASNEPGVSVSPVVYKAAEGVKDGELVPTPVQEGTSYAVVWRRGTQAGVHHTVNEVRVQIQDAITRQKREVAQKALIDKLRAEKLTMVNDTVIGDFDISVDDGTIGPKRRR